MPEGLSLRLIGRANELQGLTQALRAFESGSSRAPGLVTISGEPGVGKSRLTVEAREMLGEANLRWVTTRCAPHGPRHPWHPLRHLLTTLARLEPDLPSEEKQRRLTEMGETESLSAESLDAARYLLSQPTTDARWPDLPATERRGRLFAAMRDLIRELARDRPTVFVLEDFHWVDPESLQWLDGVLSDGFVNDKTARPQVLVIVVHRVEFRHLWPTRIHRLDIPLHPLGERHSRSLLREIFGITDDLPNDLVDRLVRHVGGNPFFIEEALRLLIDRGDLTRTPEGTYRVTREPRDIALPSSQRGLVHERVQSLEKRLRQLLQCASIIGPEVRPEVLAHLVEAVEQLDTPLETLVDEQLLERREALQGLTLLFRHSITQEVTYSTLLRRRREQLHGRLGLYLEELHGDHLDEAAELLAHHFGYSNLPDKAITYLRLAAEQAKQLCAHDAAEAHLARLAQILDAHAADVDDAHSLGVWVSLERGRLARLQGEFARACDLFAHAENHFNGNTSMVVQVLRTWGETERQRGHHTQAVDLHQRAMEMCRDLRRREPGEESDREETLCQLGLGIAYRVSGRLREALKLFSEAEARSRKLGDVSALASALNNRGICLLNMGRGVDALEPIEKAIALRRELGDQRNLVATLNNQGIVLERLLELDRALATYAEALRLAYEIGHMRAIMANHINAGQLLQRLDNHPEATRHFNQVLEHCREKPDDVAKALALINLGWSRIHCGEIDSVEPLLAQAESLSTSTDDHSVAVHAHLLRAQLALAIRDADRSQIAASAAVEALTRSGGGDEMPTALRLRGLAETAQGHSREAQESLRKAAEEAKRNVDRHEQVMIYLAEAKLARAMGREAARRRHLKRAERMLARHPIPLLKRFLNEVRDR